MNKKDTVLIVYPTGSYGTFLEWCLNYFSGRLTIETLPFKNNGSAHGFLGNCIDFDDSITFDDYFSSELNYDTARTHGLTPLTRQLGSIENYINECKSKTRFLINIVVDKDYHLLVFYNNITKINFTSFTERLKEMAQITDLDEVWVKREKMSFKVGYIHCLWDYFEDNDNQLTITVSDLITNLKKTLTLIFNKIGFTFEPSRIDQIDSIVEQWLNLQKYRHIDQLCKTIVDCTINNINFDWSEKNLTIYDEAYIQMCLRDLHNIELKCYNLNEFPTNSSDLRKILIHGKPV